MPPSKKSVGTVEGGVTSFMGGKNRGAAEVARPAAQIGQVSESEVVGWGYVLRRVVVRSRTFTAQTKLLDSTPSLLLLVSSFLFSPPSLSKVGWGGDARVAGVHVGDNVRVRHRGVRELHSL